MGFHGISEAFRASAKELRRVRSLVTIAMLLALQIILGALTLQLDSSIQITFDYLPLCVTAMFFGPVPAILSGALADLLSFIIRPTGAFNPGFMLTAAVNGLIYGLFFYKKNFDKPWKLILSCALSRLIAVIIGNICLNSLWLILMYGQGAWAWIPGRILKNVIEYPVSVLLLFSLQGVMNRIRQTMTF